MDSVFLSFTAKTEMSGSTSDTLFSRPTPHAATDRIDELAKDRLSSGGRPESLSFKRVAVSETLGSARTASADFDAFSEGMLSPHLLSSTFSLGRSSSTTPIPPDLLGSFFLPHSPVPPVRFAKRDGLRLTPVAVAPTIWQVFRSHMTLGFIPLPSREESLGELLLKKFRLGNEQLGEVIEWLMTPAYRQTCFEMGPESKDGYLEMYGFPGFGIVICLADQIIASDGAKVISRVCVLPCMSAEREEDPPVIGEFYSLLEIRVKPPYRETDGMKTKFASLYHELQIMRLFKDSPYLFHSYVLYFQRKGSRFEESLLVEEMEGGNLAKFVANDKIPKQIRIIRGIEYLICLGKAVQEIHARGLIHHDIKPENVLIDPKKGAQLADFESTFFIPDLDFARRGKIFEVEKQMIEKWNEEKGVSAGEGILKRIQSSRSFNMIRRLFEVKYRCEAAYPSLSFFLYELAKEYRDRFKEEDPELYAKALELLSLLNCTFSSTMSGTMPYAPSTYWEHGVDTGYVDDYAYAVTINQIITILQTYCDLGKGETRFANMLLKGIIENCRASFPSYRISMSSIDPLIESLQDLLNILKRELG